ncbi:MAG: PilZ domain-containing protein [Kofleriaceae bacterium]|nr:PilZ domain-containing protein [Myxococcales bacterium]MCB9563745.1 PilZ domain-containing protein [Kofleriaceae bacterium]
MARSYEELMGAIGRAMFFRPERKRVRDLWSREANPALLIGGVEHALFDVSMNGVSFVTREGTWEIGRPVEIELRLHDAAVYEGAARVARCEPVPGGNRVALALAGGFLDLPEVMRRDEEARLERELWGGPAATWSLVPAGYADALMQIVHFVQFYRASLARHEARYRAEGNASARQLDELAARAADAMRGPWNELERTASRAAMECLTRPEVLRASKAVTETVLTPLLIEAPMIRRSYHKPLGYPGDYQVMLYYYDNTFEGESVVARVFHKFFVEHPLSNGVRTREQYVVELMGREMERVQAARVADPARGFAVTSLGCGPAREVADFVTTRGAWDGEAHWILIDQEEETLSVAYRGAQRAIASTGALGSLHCLNLSFAQLLQEPALMKSVERQDFIYSTGLFDYLREGRAQALIAGLYERLAPGGLLAIGNALAPNEWFWSPEFVLDWTLLYRTRDEMLRLAAKVAGEPEVEVTVEPGGAYFFLLLRKPASAA